MTNIPIAEGYLIKRKRAFLTFSEIYLCLLLGLVSKLKFALFPFDFGYSRANMFAHALHLAFFFLSFDRD